MDNVIGRFSMINNKLLVILDETEGKDSFANNNKIKNIITAKQVPWERKCIDGVKIKNCGRYLIFSNNSTPVKIETSDRRFVVYQCANDHRNDPVYFKALYAAFEDKERVRAFYDYLMSIDISDWDSINDRPLTKCYKNIQSTNIPLIARFIDTYLLKNIKDTFCGKKCGNISSADLYTKFRGWLSKNNINTEINANKFSREMKEYDGFKAMRFSGVRGYQIDIPTVEKFMKDNNYVEDIESTDEKLSSSYEDGDDVSEMVY